MLLSPPLRVPPLSSPLRHAAPHHTTPHHTVHTTPMHAVCVCVCLPGCPSRIRGAPESGDVLPHGTQPRGRFGALFLGNRVTAHRAAPITRGLVPPRGVSVRASCASTRSPPKFPCPGRQHGPARELGVAQPHGPASLLTRLACRRFPLVNTI